MLPDLGLHIRAIDWDDALSVLKQTKHCVASICCVKTWCNAWTTSARMHDAQQMSCLFGCEGESDNIQHYLKCERLWNPIFQRLCISPYNDVLERLAVKHPSRERMLALAVVFIVYHKYRSQARSRGVQLIFSASEVRESARAAASLVKF